MSEICRELGIIAMRCADADVANMLLHARDWIEVCETTIREQKIVISELRKHEGLKAGHPGGHNFRPRYGRMAPDTGLDDSHVIWDKLGKVKAGI